MSRIKSICQEIARCADDEKGESLSFPSGGQASNHHDVGDGSYDPDKTEVKQVIGTAEGHLTQPNLSEATHCRCATSEVCMNRPALSLHADPPISSILELTGVTIQESNFPSVDGIDREEFADAVTENSSISQNSVPNGSFSASLNLLADNEPSEGQPCINDTDVPRSFAQPKEVEQSTAYQVPEQGTVRADACNYPQSNSEEQGTEGEPFNCPVQETLPDNIADLVRDQELGPDQTSTHINRSSAGRDNMAMLYNFILSVARLRLLHVLVISVYRHN